MSRKKNKYLKDFDKDNIRFYYGIPHCHTNFSTGRGSTSEAYEYGRKSGLDFMFITDHNSHLTDEIKIKNETYSKFQATRYYSYKIGKKYDDFLPLVGFETKTNVYGDLNILNSEKFFTGVVRDLNVNLPLYLCQCYLC